MPNDDKRGNNLPVRLKQCQSCPFNSTASGDWLAVRPLLTHRALNEGTPICHSTGQALVRHNGERLPAHLCRGARNLQLTLFYALGYITAPTDEAWDAKRRERDV